MAAKFFIEKDGETSGPMSASDVKTLAQSGTLMPNDLVWQEGSEKKVRANQVKGLTFKSPQVVPPSPAQDDVPSPVKDNVPSVRSEPSNSNDQREFHYEINGEVKVAARREELQELVRQGVITKETQVWHDGLEDWTPASAIDELMASFPADAKKAPPSLPKKASPPLKAATSQTSNDPVPPVGSGSRHEVASSLTIHRVSENEVVISSRISQAFDSVAQAMERVGRLKRQDRQKQFIEGRIKYGFQSVNTRASLVERSQGETTVVVQASSDDVWNAGGKTATKRLVETLLNLDNPGYQPDRLGIHPAALVGVIIGFAVLVGTIVFWILPSILEFLGV